MWHDEATRQLGICFLEAGGLRSQSVLDALWPYARVAGAADYDGDGFPDLLTRLGGPRGTLIGFFMNGGEILYKAHVGELRLPGSWQASGNSAPRRDRQPGSLVAVVVSEVAQRPKALAIFFREFLTRLRDPGSDAFAELPEPPRSRAAICGAAALEIHTSAPQPVKPAIEHAIALRHDELVAVIDQTVSRRSLRCPEGRQVGPARTLRRPFGEEDRVRVAPGRPARPREAQQRLGQQVYQRHHVVAPRRGPTRARGRSAEPSPARR